MTIIFENNCSYMDAMKLATSFASPAPGDFTSQFRMLYLQTWYGKQAFQSSTYRPRCHASKSSVPISCGE